MRKLWTTDEVKILRKMYPDQLTSDIAERLCRSKASVYGKAKFLGLEKSQAFFQSEKSGRLTGKENGYRFQKGHTPPNKGQKMSADVKEKIKHTFFNKGHQPHNTLYDGAIRTRVDRTGRRYQFIRVKLGKWELLHRYNYKKHHGEIPRGMIVAFIDGNSMNCDPSNLELISKQENMRRNTIHNYPDSVKKAIRTLSKLNKNIKRHEKQN